MPIIPYGRQNIDQSDLEAVMQVLQSDWLTQGPAVESFESAIAARVGAKHAIAVNSATSALHLACLVLGLGPGKILWTTPITFVASANCAIYCGADVDFVDIEPRTYNICADALKVKLESAARIGRLPNIVVAVDFAGHPCELKKLRELAQYYDFKLVEDASHAVGACYEGVDVGSGQFSDMTIFSFHPVKIITTGEGGIVLTNNDEWASRLRLLRSHGITRDPGSMIGPSEGAWYYQQVELGYNYRLPDILAALGKSQLFRLDEFLRRRHELAVRYDIALESLPIERPWRSPASYSALHLYPILISDMANKTRRQVFDHMRQAEILVNVHYIPVHLQPYYRARGFAPGQFPEAERYYARTISLPMYFGLTDAEQDYVIEVLKEALH